MNNTSSNIIVEKVLVEDPEMMDYVAGDKFAEVLHRIEEKYGVIVTVPIDVRVEGSAENVRAAKLTILENMPWEQSYKIGFEYLNLVFGYKGETVRAISLHYKVEIAFENEMVIISGKKDSCEDALKAIKRLIINQRKVEGISADKKDNNCPIEVNNQERFDEMEVLEEMFKNLSITPAQNEVESLDAADKKPLVEGAKENFSRDPNPQQKQKQKRTTTLNELNEKQELGEKTLLGSSLRPNKQTQRIHIMLPIPSGKIDMLLEKATGTETDFRWNMA